MSSPASTPPPPTEIDKYFARYHDFDYDPAAPAASEFQRLSKQKNWRLPDGTWTKKGRGHRGRFHQAFDREFAEKFGFLEEGGREDRQQKWMYLAEVLELDPIPNTITHFRKDMKYVWVNIYDVLDAEKTGETVTRFPNLKALAIYSRANDDEKVFSKRRAKGGALKFLLKKIFGASGSNKGRSSGGVGLEDVFQALSMY